MRAGSLAGDRVDALIDLDRAYDILFPCLSPLGVEAVPLSDALYRVLAEPIHCDVDYPPFDRAVMDGYAVRAADVATVPVSLRVVGQVAAGAMPTSRLRAGEAVQINTGAPIPEGADAVVRVESTESEPGGAAVSVLESVPAGQFITRRATYVSAGQVVLEPGRRMTPAAISTTASAGAASLRVYRRPRVAVVATGDELVDVDRKPTGAMIRNSNQYLLEALIRAARAESVTLGVARDDRGVVRERIERGLASDVLCITGGVSMGAFDFVPEVLEALGATFRIRKLAIKPGRPTIFATTPDGKLIFALPGNPASALVGFVLLVSPALAALEGQAAAPPVLMRAALEGSVGATRDRRTYLPAVAGVGVDGHWQARPVSWHGSGDAFGSATANALIMRPPRSDAAELGDVVWVLPFERG